MRFRFDKRKSATLRNIRAVASDLRKRRDLSTVAPCNQTNLRHLMSDV